MFSCYYCFIDLKRQSEQSGLHHDTSSLVSFSNWIWSLMNAKMDHKLESVTKRYTLKLYLFQKIQK